MELLLWQYISMIVIAIILLVCIIIFVKDLTKKLIYSALWVAFAVTLLAFLSKLVGVFQSINNS